MIDNEYLDEFLWEIDKQQVDVDELPDSAFDSQAERDRVEELFDQYNGPSNDDSDDEENDCSTKKTAVNRRIEIIIIIYLRQMMKAHNMLSE